jgi:putative aldouronate transport system permease protein
MQMKKSIHRSLLIMCFPAIALLFLFQYVPMFGIILAFKDYRYDKGIWGSDWVGFKNFEFFFNSQDAFRVTFNTIFMNLLFIVTVTVGAIFLAIILSEITRKTAVKLFQTTLFFPYFLSWPVVAFITFAFLNVDLGILNRWLEQLGFDFILWYQKPELWPYILTIVNFWKQVGYNTIIFYAGIMAIDRSYYEAAEVDGATKNQMRWKITVPLLMPLIVILTILALGGIFHSDFGLFYMVTKDTGTLYSTTSVIDTYVYRSFIAVGDVGMSAAVGFYQAIVGFLLVITVNTIIRRINAENALF